MKIKNNIQIFDDNGVNIDGKACVITYYYETTHNKLDGVYGVSGAERSSEDDYVVKKYGKALAIFNENDNSFTDIYGNRFNLDRYTITDAKIIDVNKL